jgi:hypothetical protein
MHTGCQWEQLPIRQQLIVSFYKKFVGFYSITSNASRTDFKKKYFWGNLVKITIFGMTVPAPLKGPDFFKRLIKL